MNYKKVLVYASLLALITAPSCQAGSAGSSNIRVSNQAEFTSALDNINSGGVIILDNNITLSGNKTLPNKVISIDFNGFTINNQEFNLNQTTGLTLINPKFSGNNTLHLGSGAAVNNISGTILTVNGSALFENGHSNDDSGAVYPQSSTSVFNGKTTFRNNKADNCGGAIESRGSSLIFNNKVTFEGNHAAAWGGAVLVNGAGGFVINNGALFKNNTANSGGGAITIANGTATLIADTYNVEFTGNSVNGNDNAIHFWDSSSVLNLNASSTNSIIFNDGISGNGTININKTGNWDNTPTNLAASNNIRINAPISGAIVINGDMSTFAGTLNLHSGTLALGTNGVFFNSANFIASPGATLNLSNNKIDNISLSNANLNNLNLSIDVNLDNATSDTLTATGTVTNNAKDIVVTNINVMKDKPGPFVIDVDPDNKFNISSADGLTASGKIFDTYTVTQNADKSFTLTGKDFSPKTQSTGVAQQATYGNITAINNVLFSKAEDVINFMNNIEAKTGISYDNANKVAAIEGNAEYNNLYERLETGSAWFKPFNNIESLDTKYLSDVDSKSYGMVIGYDSPLKRLKKGYKAMYSLYGGYSGAKQNFSDVESFQNGGFLGVMASFYKKKLFGSISSNIGGAGVSEHIENYGSSTYGVLSTSVSSKLGYNFDINKNTTLQLNTQLGYSLINSGDYTSSQGIIYKSKPLHTIQITPGAKVSKRHKDLNFYLATNVIFNPLNSTSVTANDIVLPNSSLGKYIEYGVGVEKFNKNKSSGFIQVMAKNGSRTGVNLQFGYKVPVGSVERL